MPAIKTSIYFFDKLVKFLEILKEVSHLSNDSVKVAKIRHVFVKLHRIVLQINGKQNITFQFSVKLFSNKMHEATFKLVLTQRQYVVRPN